MSDVAAPNDCDEIQRYQLNHQVTFPAIIRLVDRYLPNTFTQHNEKFSIYVSKSNSKMKLH
ncbi:transcriptional repressor of carbohydrate metabolism [Actinobacillus equuli]|nr:transcriptional repressor of carbohydrate metabolism [Actinobacillus equuli]